MFKKIAKAAAKLIAWSGAGMVVGSIASHFVAPYVSGMVTAGVAPATAAMVGMLLGYWWMIGAALLVWLLVAWIKGDEDMLLKVII